MDEGIIFYCLIEVITYFFPPLFFANPTVLAVIFHIDW